MPGRIRIDHLLEGRGLAGSAREARGLILAGHVWICGQRVDKVGTLVPIDAQVTVTPRRRFVSRGGDKLWAWASSQGLLGAFKGARVLDVGASTGGFTDCVLSLGAREVLCVDVGTAQLDVSLREDPRVRYFEQQDVRGFELPCKTEVDWVLADVSFCSLVWLGPALARLIGERGQAVFLIKPQFEARPEEVPRGGVLTDSDQIGRIVARTVAGLAACGLGGGCAVPSEVRGRSGNQEFFYWLRARSDRTEKTLASGYEAEEYSGASDLMQ